MFSPNFLEIVFLGTFLVTVPHGGLLTLTPSVLQILSTLWVTQTQIYVFYLNEPEWIVIIKLCSYVFIRMKLSKPLFFCSDPLRFF